ncbi:hypothetical protein TSUD_38630 [Trifolium subterraneum]|uniref:3'-5' exonuclease domain-containing protein n=1 Tax=Trifolium subterraneum TaxID=3900 RepID=A0A2Z6MWY9_TRISU|nr:hypothetical protein TSUD_38630 [Trifolium subterraneum]
MNHNLHIFNLNGVSVKTTVSDEFIFGDLSGFFQPVNDYKTKVFGFDVEWLVKPDESACNCAIALCYGQSCLIIHFSTHVPEAVVNFLHRPNYTFVGFGIKENVARLEKKYGFGCRNAVELGPLAANLMKKPILSYYGVDELAFEVCQLDLHKLRPFCSSFMDSETFDFSKKRAKFATINAYSYHKIGSKLFARFS